ncbi:MAG: hypothetical protein NDI61_10170 [Bdellovibrionaceae bacterium]|nr:hypothetical protein [Pseudobdellovibrionaceae bacterium]
MTQNQSSRPRFTSRPHPITARALTIVAILLFVAVFLTDVAFAALPSAGSL